MLSKLILFILLFLSLSCQGFPLSPRTEGSYCTSTHLDFDGYRYNEQIPHCKRHVSSKLKKRLYKEYGIAYSDHKEYTIDHIIPLSLGGDNSKNNLWPQHKEIYTGHIEYELFIDVRDGLTSIRNAINALLYQKDHPGIPWNEIYRR